MTATLLCLALTTATPADCYPRYRSYYNYCYPSYKSYCPPYKVRIKPVAVSVYAPFAVAVPAYGASYNPGYGTPPLGVSGGASAVPGAVASGGGGAISAVDQIVAEIRKLNGNLAAINQKVDATSARLAALEARVNAGSTAAPPAPRPPARKPPPPEDDDNGKKEDADKKEEQQVFLAHAASRCAACHTEGENPKGDFVLFRAGAPARLAALGRSERALSAALGRLSDRALAKLEDESFTALDAETLDRIAGYAGKGKCPPEGNGKGVAPLTEAEQEDWRAWVKAAKDNIKRTAARKARRMRFVRRDL